MWCLFYGSNFIIVMPRKNNSMYNFHYFQKSWVLELIICAEDCYINHKLLIRSVPLSEMNLPNSNPNSKSKGVWGHIAVRTIEGVLYMWGWLLGVSTDQAIALTGKQEGWGWVRFREGRGHVWVTPTHLPFWETWAGLSGIIQCPLTHVKARAGGCSWQD